jgi:hypothetical protein
VLPKATLAIGVLLAGAGAGAWMLGAGGADPPDSAVAAAPAPSPDASGSDYAHIIDGLSATLELEVAERQRLEEQVESLRAQVARLERQLGEDDPRAAARESRPSGRDAAPALTAAEAEEEANAALAPFLEAGFDPARAEYVKQLQDDMALQRLYLRDQAEREGWLRTPRYREAMQAIAQRETDLRQDLGDQDYDRYLYAIGRPNRILVGDVLENGPAERAGIQPGDAILSYAGERVYDAGSLVNATREGTAGATTAVEIEREGSTQLVYVPRGPLGINIRVARIRPSD